MPVAKAVQVLKANSSRWSREHGLDFAWQEGYGTFSVSSSNKDADTEYIQHQAELLPELVLGIKRYSRFPLVRPPKEYAFHVVVEIKLRVGFVWVDNRNRSIVATPFQSSHRIRTLGR